MLVGIINTSNQGHLNQFIEENSITYPIIFDPGSPGGVQGGDTYNLYYMPNDGSPYPRDFIIDQDGIMRVEPEDQLGCVITWRSRVAAGRLRCFV